MRVKIIWRIDNQVMQRCVMSLMRRRRLKDGIKRPPHAPFLSGPGAGFPFRDSARTVDPIVYQIIQTVVIIMSPSTGYINKAKGLHHEPARGISRRTINPKGLLHEVPGWTYDLGDQINQPKDSRRSCPVTKFVLQKVRHQASDSSLDPIQCSFNHLSIDHYGSLPCSIRNNATRYALNLSNIPTPCSLITGHVLLQIYHRTIFQFHLWPQVAGYLRHFPLHLPSI